MPHEFTIEAERRPQISASAHDKISTCVGKCSGIALGETHATPNVEVVFRSFLLRHDAHAKKYRDHQLRNKVFFHDVCPPDLSCKLWFLSNQHPVSTLAKKGEHRAMQELCSPVGRRAKCRIHSCFL